MANAVAEGAGAELFAVDDFSGSDADYDAIAFGCPAMGDEGYIVNEAPSDDDLAKLKALGAELAG